LPSDPISLTCGTLISSFTLGPEGFLWKKRRGRGKILPPSKTPIHRL